MKRLLIFMLVPLLLLPCFYACKDTPAPDEQTTESGQVEPTPGSEDLVLVKDGASSYVIVRPADLTANDPAFLAAVLFRDAVEKLTGVALQIVTDNESDYAASESEIIIGNARNSTYTENTVFASDGKLYVGGEVQLLSDMIAAFFQKCFDVDIHAQEVSQMNELKVPADLTMNQAGEITSPSVAQDPTAWGDSIAYADDIANLINFRYIGTRREVAEISNGDMRMVYNLAQKDNKQVAGLYNTRGSAYLTDTMDAFVVTDDGSRLYASQSGSSGRGNIYRFGYYYYDIHLLSQGFLPSAYDIDESAGSYNALNKVRKISSNMMESATIKDGVITAVVSDTTDPYFHWNVNYQAKNYNALRITMRTEYATRAYLYLTAGSYGGFNGDQLIGFSIEPG